MRIAFTRIPQPEIEEIDPAQSKVIRPGKKPGPGAPSGDPPQPRIDAGGAGRRASAQP
jgi:hypothetical protein